MKVVLGGLKDRAEELQSFLEPRVGVKPSVSGGELEMEESAIRKGVRPRQVKTYVKRFLHQKGLRKTFRVLVNGSQLTIQELEREEEEKKEEGKKEKEAPKKMPEGVGDTLSAQPEALRFLQEASDLKLSPWERMIGSLRELRPTTASRSWRALYAAEPTGQAPAHGAAQRSPPTLSGGDVPRG